MTCKIKEIVLTSVSGQDADLNIHWSQRISPWLHSSASCRRRQSVLRLQSCTNFAGKLLGHIVPVGHAVPMGSLSVLTRHARRRPLKHDGMWQQICFFQIFRNASWISSDSEESQRPENSGTCSRTNCLALCHPAFRLERQADTSSATFSRRSLWSLKRTLCASESRGRTILTDILVKVRRPMSLQ